MKSNKQPVYGLSCKACGKAKNSITMMLCPECERAVFEHFPPSYFEDRRGITDEELTLTAYKVLEALELASIDAPIALAA